MVDLIVSAGHIYTEQGVLKNAGIAVAKNKIQAIDQVEKFTLSAETQQFTFPDTFHIVPGFIDLHIHGANGSDVMDESPDALAVISRALVQEGTTAFLATTMTAAPEKIASVLGAIRDYMQVQHEVDGATIVGIHLEGPFLSPDRVGAQRADKILLPTIDYILQWQKESGQQIKMVTLAPELPDSLPFIEFLQQKNIIAAIGHTNATYAETMAAIDAGCSHATHVFNAMRGLHHREPGAVGAALLSDHVSAELIVDGVHLHPAIVQLVLQLKGKENTILVTDAMRAKCMPDGQYDLGDQVVTVQEGVAKLSDGTLAGSTLTMAQSIQNVMQFTGCKLGDAVKFAAENPAKKLNIFHQKGSLAHGKDADFVVLDDRYRVVLTVCGGRVVYSPTVV